MKNLFMIFVLLGLSPIAAGAGDTIVRFDGGIGVIPVQGIALDSGAPVFNIVRGFFPGGAPWTISRLEASVKADSRIKVDGRGLVLAGGSSIGNSLGLHVRAVLLCGPIKTSTAHVSEDTVLSAGGDFFIESALTPSVQSCDTPALLIVTGSSWLAAGIPAQDDTGSRD